MNVGGVDLAGKIDRVEIGDGIFTIGDYKTGTRMPKIRAIREGRSLQLPIYLVVVQKLLKKLILEDFQAVGGIYYILRENGKAELGIGDRQYNGIAFKAHSNNHQLLPKNSNPKLHQVSPDFDYEEETIQSVIDRSVMYVSDYVSSISNGQFPLTPHDPKDVCAYCDFKRICRIGAIVEDDSAR
jgi:ATP-dependent helicase/DNAse subunit B